MNKRRILVTSALPYANGAIHLGHLVEYIQTDIWVRFQRMQGHEVHYVGADDTHGTPVMLRAHSEGIKPEELIARVWKEHKRDFDDFLVDFNNYYSTHSPENRALCEEIYGKLDSGRLIAKQEVEQFYDPVKNMFLPDRFIKGECPKCGAKDQYGDSCEVCGTTYSPTDLKNPYSTISGAKPIRKSSEHHFFRLSQLKEFLTEWTEDNHLQPEARNKMREWLTTDLRDWDISRDEPYFGFAIPGTNNKKFFYVWLDAPVGYMASFKNLCTRKEKEGTKIQFIDFWGKRDSSHEEITPLDEVLRDEETELIHFIGKDILYFHALFWPAMLDCAGYRTPSKIYAHGFLTVNGEKMSKSRGTFITAESYIKQGLNPEWLRYYYAAKLNATMEDIDLNLDDFVARVNSDLVGKYINIASRCAGFITKRFDGKIGHPDPSAQQIEHNSAFDAREIADYYEGREYGKAMRKIM
ncbi:MAG: methionine--tRNA ligase, partial [Pseudomonadota bacterium]